MMDLSLNFTKLANTNQNPFSNVKYRPELDVTEFCSEEEHQFYQQMIDILRWIIELGRIDICMEVSHLSRYLAEPRTGHLVQVLHIFSFLIRIQSMHGYLL